jgi:glycosyltransferase involved in cell wall biosynthesis
VSRLRSAPHARSEPWLAEVLHPAAVAAFWTSAGLVAWTYVGFPLVSLVRGWLRPVPVAMADIEPSVSVIVAAHNEEDVIGRKVENLLALEHPADRLEIIIASDGSDDATEEIVRGFGDRVRLLALPRGGKAAALEAAVASASGEILVFTDANSLLAPDAMRRLVRPLADFTVGGVAGDQRYGELVDETERGERGFWAFDRMLKESGSRAGNAIAATGALYAIRRELFRPIPPGVNDDYYSSAGVIEQGQRLVYEPDAVAVEPAAPSLEAEFARKVRVMSRGFQSELRLRALLDPRRHGFYSVQMASHKILRRAAGVPLLILAVSSVVAARRSRLLRLAAAAQAAGYLAGGIGWLGAGRLRGPLRSALALPAYFVMANAAGVVALLNLLRGRRIDRWTSPREPVR